MSISIHALRVEGDQLTPLWAFAQIIFLSTPSGWRATQEIWSCGIRKAISIHALRVEGDCEDYAGNFGQAVISIHALRVEGDS